MSLKRVGGLLGIGLSLAIIAGCGGGGGSQESAGGKIDENATLRAGWTVGVKTLDPHMAYSEVVSFRFGLNAVYDRLFTVDATGAVKGMLVDTWAYSDDGLELDLKLREDVTFRDGSKLDAEVVKVNLDRARTLESPIVKAKVANIKSVDIAGPFELKLSLDKPTVSDPYELANVSGFIMHPDLIKNGDPAKETNGSGAYEVDKWVPGETLNLVRDRDDYWDTKAAKIAKLEHQAIPDFQAFSNALAGGQIDIGQFQPSQVASLENQPGLKTVRVPQGIGIDLQLNFKMKPLDSLKVRQAINYAYDRKGIVDALYPGSVAKYQPYREGLPGYDKALETSYSFDTAKAKSLLADAGYPEGIDLGEILVSTAVTPGLVDVLQKQFAAAGIKFKPLTVDAAQIFARWAAGKDSAALQFASTGTEPGAGASRRWKAPSSNPAGTDAEFEKLLAAGMDNRISPEARDEAYQKLSRYTVEQAWAAPVVWNNFPWVMTDRLQNFSAKMDYATLDGPYDFRYLTMTTK